MTQLGGTLSHFNLGPANPGSIESSSHRNIEGLGLEAVSGPQRNVYPRLGRDVATQQESERVAENPFLIAGPNERRKCIGQFNLGPQHIELRNGPGLEAPARRLQFPLEQFFRSFLNDDLLHRQEHIAVGGPHLEKGVGHQRLVGGQRRFPGQPR